MDQVAVNVDERGLAGLLANDVASQIFSNIVRGVVMACGLILAK